MIIPLKIVSDYSLLKSVVKIDELIKFLLENGIRACALCDENLYGAMDFYTKMIKNGLRPIIGLQVKITDYEVYLYAKNYKGYQNLLKIHSLKEFGELNFENLNKYLDDIKIILPRASYELKEQLTGAYLGYVNDTEKMRAMLSSEDVVYYRDVRALKEKDTEYLKYLVAIDKGILLKDVVLDWDNAYMNLNVKEEDKRTTIDFSADINIVIPQGGKYIPKYNKKGNSEEFLESLTEKGLRKRLNGVEDERYSKRLLYELDVIKKMGFVDYFLIVYDYVLYAKKNNILVGPGRGSAAGSLVSYTLGITDIDPIKYDLMFERFLNPDRVTMPDIDIDFEYTKRSQVIDYVRERYGYNRVAPIMTFGTLGSKQVIRDVARVLNIEIAMIDKFSALINAKESLKENLEHENVKAFLHNYGNLQEMYKVAMRLEGLKRHISTHAAGVVISSVDLDEVIPISKSGDNIMTGVTMEYLEDLGLLKMDFLALRNLTIIANVLALIKENTGKVINLNKIDLNDKSVLKLFCDADTEGIFQYESSGMRNLMQKLRPSSFSDLVASVALFRPGPMENIDLFIARKYGKEKIEYLQPDLEPILKETYGVIVYQEQVMQILVKIGGYTNAQADNIRRAMSKKKEEVMRQDREHFITSAGELGYKKEVALEIYDLIMKFARYGFNKAHSVSYALIGYQMAYLKVKAPVYFITNLLNMSMGSVIKTKEYIDEAKSKGIVVIKPDINLGLDKYKITKDGLMLPLGSVKNLGGSASFSIIEERDRGGVYKDYLDFVARNYGKNINRKVIVALILSGVLDSLGLNKKEMMDNLDVVINYAELVGSLDESFVMKPTIMRTQEYTEEALREMEFNAYGFYLSKHPVSKYNSDKVVKLKNLKDYFDKRVRCVLLVENIRTIKTKRGDNMAFITASDETGNGEVVVFPKQILNISTIRAGDIIEMQARVTKRFDNYQLTMDFCNKVKG